MTTAASRATGRAATSSSASSVTAITALPDLPCVRSAYQPVITLTSQKADVRRGPSLLHAHDMSRQLNATRLSRGIIPAALRGLAPSGWPRTIRSGSPLERRQVIKCEIEQPVFSAIACHPVGVLADSRLTS